MDILGAILGPIAWYRRDTDIDTKEPKRRAYPALWLHFILNSKLKALTPVRPFYLWNNSDKKIQTAIRAWVYLNFSELSHCDRRTNQSWWSCGTDNTSLISSPTTSTALAEKLTNGRQIKWCKLSQRSKNLSRKQNSPSPIYFVRGILPKTSSSLSWSAWWG